MSFFKSYEQLFEQSLNGIDTTFVPNKYLNPKKNYKRFELSLLKAKKMGFSRGLDFGCGCVGSPIIAKLCGLQLVGLDIPYGIDDSAEGERNRHGIVASSVANKESVHLGIQKNLQKMGYEIVIRDTNNYPWNEFPDNDFQFMLAYFALSKEWVNHKDTLNFSGEVYRQRLLELVRISAQNSVWFVHPKNHIRSIHKYKDLLMTKGITLLHWV